MRTILWGLALVAAATAACSQPVYRSGGAPLTPVASVDLDRYAGRWYEIYRLPNSFEDAACDAVSADYALRGDGLIQVVNTCVRGDGEVERSRGVARVVDAASRARLEVSFFRPFWGAYWIVALSEDYRWALIAEPAGKYLWLLARTPQLDSAEEAQLLQRVAALGYPTDRLIKPAQRRAAPPP